MPDDDAPDADRSADRDKSQAELVRGAVSRKPQALIVEPETLLLDEPPLPDVAPPPELPLDDEELPDEPLPDVPVPVLPVEPV